MSIKFLLPGGGGIWGFGGGGVPFFCFYGREEFSDSNSRFMRLFQAPFDTCLDSTFFASL